MKKVAILGFGREGQSLLKFLKKSPQWKSAAITILDKNANLKTPRGIKAITGHNYLKELAKFDIVFRSPGIAFSQKEITSARRAGVTFSSATKLFFEQLEQLPKKPIIIGITGTKGKGTTATMLYEMLKAAHKKVILAGNIGLPMLDQLKAAAKAEMVILELSSFQLQDLRASPHIAVVLGITPDHLDAHKDMDEYVEAKKVITKYQKKTDHVFYVSDNEKAEHVAFQSSGIKHEIDPKNWRLFSQSNLRVPGAHMFANAVVAATVAKHLGASDEAILKAVKNFKGTQYRLQLVRELTVRPGISIQFYNDSAGTNPETAAAAAGAFKVPTVIIVGGRDKGLSYEPLREALRSSSVSKVILYGENQEKIAQELQNIKPVEHVLGSLKDAVIRAFVAALDICEKEHGNAVVLFSPAAASFDMFRDYKDRGEQFDAIVKKLKI